RVPGPQAQHGTQALVGEGGRHADVRDDDVGQRLLVGEAVDLALEGGAVADRRHGVAAAGQEGGESVAEDRRVLGEDDPEPVRRLRGTARRAARHAEPGAVVVGRCTVITVGPPAGLDRSTRPSTDRTRSTMPARPERSPVPSGGTTWAPPRPSSRTWMRTPPRSGTS